MPRFIDNYSDLLRIRLQEFKPKCWLINTGWWGGEFGKGSRIDLKITRDILSKCISDSFDNNNFIKSDYFDLSFPLFLDNKKSISLNPIDKWKDKHAYKKSALKLNSLFNKNYSKISLK